MKQFFAGRASTVLLIDDHSGREGDAQLESLAHGVICLEQQSVEYGIARRRVEIVKMRGVPFVGGYHDATIRTGGLRVFPRLRAKGRAAPDGQLSSGVDGLDDLLGGGLSWGTSTLITGPAGTGKTTVASQYLASALEGGHRVAAYLFDERHATFVGRAEALGLPFGSALASGQMHMAQIQPGTFVAGEFADAVRQSVEQDGARVVLIDTINGYLAAMPGLTSPVLRLYELLTVPERDARRDRARDGAAGDSGRRDAGAGRHQLHRRYRGAAAVLRGERRGAPGHLGREEAHGRPREHDTAAPDWTRPATRRRGAQPLPGGAHRCADLHG